MASGPGSPAIGWEGQPCDAGWIGYADYLNWKARRGGLDFAAPVQILDQDIPRSVESQTFGRDNGVRAGIGYHFASGWDLTWNYTHFQTEGSESITSASAATGLLATRSLLSTTLMQSISADGSLRLNVHDVEASWRSYLNDTAAWRGFGGFRWAGLDEEFNNGYTFQIDPTTSVDGIIHLPTRMTAGGVRLGFEFQWGPPCGLRAFGRMAESLLTADFRMRQQESNSAQGVIIDLPQSADHFLTVLELAAGLSWCQGPLQLSGGYELSDWTSIATINRDPQRLSFDGFFLRLAYLR